MATQFYALPDGSIQGYGDGAEPPEGSVLLNASDVHDGRDTYNHQTGEIVHYSPAVPLIDRLNVIFAAQPLELRAQFGPLRAAVKTAFDYNDIEAAYATIAGASVPQELESIRTALLAEFS